MISSRTLSGVDSLVTCAASLPFSFRASVKVWTTRLCDWGGSVQRQGCGCRPATLPTSSKLLAEKSGLWYWRPSRRWSWLVVLRVLRNVVFLLVAVLIHYDLSYLIPREQKSPSHTRILTFHYRNYTTTARWVRNVSTDISRNFRNGLRENTFSLPNNRYQSATELPVTKIA